MRNSVKNAIIIWMILNVSLSTFYMNGTIFEKLYPKIPFVHAFSTENMQIDQDSLDGYAIDTGAVYYNTPFVMLQHSTLGIRSFLVFDDSTINPDEQILNATLSVYTTQELDNFTDWSVTIYGYDADSIDEDTPNPFNYAVTFSSVIWNISSVDGVGWHNVTVTNIVQEIVSREGFTGDIGFQMFASTYDEAGYYRHFNSHDRSSTYSARLEINYGTGIKDDLGSLTWVEFYRGYDIYANVSGFTDSIAVETLDFITTNYDFENYMDWIYYSDPTDQFYLYWANRSGTTNTLWYNTRRSGTWRTEQAITTFVTTNPYESSFDSEIGYFNGDKLYYGFAQSSDLEYWWRQGELQTNGSIIWDAVEQDVWRSVTYEYINVLEDFEGYARMIVRDRTATPRLTCESRNARLDGVWTDDYHSDWTADDCTGDYGQTHNQMIFDTINAIASFVYESAYDWSFMVLGDNNEYVDLDSADSPTLFIAETGKHFDLAFIPNTDKMMVVYNNYTDYSLYSNVYDYSDNTFEGKVMIYDNPTTEDIFPTIANLENGWIVTIWACDGDDYPDNNMIWCKVSESPYDSWKIFNGSTSLTQAEFIVEDLDGLTKFVSVQPWEIDDKLGLIYEDDSGNFHFLGVRVYDSSDSHYFIYQGGEFVMSCFRYLNDTEAWIDWDILSTNDPSDPFSRYKMRLYWFLLGYGLVFIPLWYNAYKPSVTSMMAMIVSILLGIGLLWSIRLM